MIFLDAEERRWVTPCGEPNNRVVVYNELRQEFVILQGWLDR